VSSKARDTKPKGKTKKEAKGSKKKPNLFHQKESKSPTNKQTKFYFKLLKRTVEQNHGPANAKL
jgi:hypothetical protein